MNLIQTFIFLIKNSRCSRRNVQFWVDNICSQFKAIPFTSTLFSLEEQAIINSLNLMVINSQDSLPKLFFYHSKSIVMTVEALNILKKYFPEIPVVGIQSIPRKKCSLLNFTSKLFLILQTPKDGIHLFHLNRNDREDPFVVNNQSELWDIPVVTGLNLRYWWLFGFDLLLVSLIAKTIIKDILNLEESQDINGSYVECLLNSLV